MGRVEQLIAHLEILCKRGAINIGQAPRDKCQIFTATCSIRHFELTLDRIAQ